MNQPRELLKAAVIDAMDAERSVHTLNPNAVRLKKALSDATGITQFGFLMVTLMPGHDAAEYHRHLYEEECVYVLSGDGEAVIDEQHYNIAAGDFLGFARGGPAHTVTNTGDEPLVLLVAGQRLEQDVCDYPRLNKRLYINGKVEELVDRGHIQQGAV
ncbi:cupin domain-containing protein [Dyella subtropica]|uniref:cupin domain-containing protein n=1 Tax=Dyella subtropica TaxID=2992127 RepID=UPI002257747B|nr:cupin domain-containing protein [Dyella subtropica]